MTMTGLAMVTEQALGDAAPLHDGLVVRLQRAEPAAVAEVYDAHHAAVRAFAKRLLGDAATAEDLSSAESKDPEHEARRKELAALLTQALDALPIDQRVAFVLCEVEERTAREAAQIVGAPEATLRTRLFHAKKKLRAALETEGVR
jgi:RNA polymerase sigma-70 factor (ECF subfamily)